MNEPSLPLATGGRPLHMEPSPHGPSHWRLALVLGSLTAFGPLAIDTYLPSFPALSRDLGVPASSVEATVAVYFLGLALGQSFYGPVADRSGRKRPLYAGLLLFILASAGCAMTQSIGALIALRFLQALGGSAQIVVARAVVRDYFDERDSARVLSLLMLVMGLAPILAPLLGGQLVVSFGWRSIFWTLAAFAAACLIAVSFTLAESLPAERRLRQNPATILPVLRPPARQSSIHGAGAGDRLHLRRHVRLYRRLALRLHGDLRAYPAHFGLFFGSNALGLIAASQINARLVHRIAPARILSVVLSVTACAGLVPLEPRR